VLRLGPQYAEIPDIESEHGLDLFPMCKVKQGGVGKLQPQCPVLLQEGPNRRRIGLVEWKQPEQVRAGQAEQLQNELGSFAQQPRRFREHGPAGEQRHPQALKLLDAPPMIRIPI